MKKVWTNGVQGERGTGPGYPRQGASKE